MGALEVVFWMEKVLQSVKVQKESIYDKLGSSNVINHCQTF